VTRTHRDRATRPPGARPLQDCAATKPPVPAAQDSGECPQPPTAGELLRRLTSPILEAADSADAEARLAESAEAARVLVAAQRLDQVAATVALTTSAQAVGVALVAAEDVVRAALWGGAR
jgi:hypothetical protein